MFEKKTQIKKLINYTFKDQNFIGLDYDYYTHR